MGIGEGQTIVGPERGRDAGPHALRVDRKVAAHFVVDALRLVEQTRVHREAVGAFRDPFKARLDARSMQVANALELRVARPVGGEAVDLGQDARLELRGLDTRARGGPHREHRCAADHRKREGGDVLRQLALAHEDSVQPRGATDPKQVGGDRQVVPRIAAEHRHPEREIDTRERHRVGNRLADLSAQDRLYGHVGRRRQVGVRRKGTEMALDHGHRPRGLEVAGDRQDRVVRRVVGREEGGDILEAGGIQVFHGADGRMVVRMALRVESGLDPLVPGAVRLVVDRPAAFVLDDLTLVVQLLLGHGRQETAEPIRLQPQPELELVTGQRLEVVGAIQPGRGVQRSAGRLDQGEVLALGDVLRPLEHHVLEEVREAGSSQLLVLAADVVPQVHGDDGSQVVGRQDDAQAVGQAMPLDGNVGHGQNSSLGAV